MPWLPSGTSAAQALHAPIQPLPGQRPPPSWLPGLDTGRDLPHLHSSRWLADDERRRVDKQLTPWLPSDRSALKALHPVAPKLLVGLPTQRLAQPPMAPPPINPHYPHYIQPVGAPKPSDRVVFTGLNNSHATPSPQPRAPAPSAPRLASLFEAVRPLHSLQNEIPRQVKARRGTRGNFSSNEKSKLEEFLDQVKQAERAMGKPAGVRVSAASGRAARGAAAARTGRGGSQRSSAARGGGAGGGAGRAGRARALSTLAEDVMRMAEADGQAESPSPKSHKSGGWSPIGRRGLPQSHQAMGDLSPERSRPSAAAQARLDERRRKDHKVLKQEEAERTSPTRTRRPEMRTVLLGEVGVVHVVDERDEADAERARERYRAALVSAVTARQTFHHELTQFKLRTQHDVAHSMLQAH